LSWHLHTAMTPGNVPARCATGRWYNPTVQLHRGKPPQEVRASPGEQAVDEGPQRPEPCLAVGCPGGPRTTSTPNRPHGRPAMVHEASRVRSRSPCITSHVVSRVVQRARRPEARTMRDRMWRATSTTSTGDGCRVACSRCVTSLKIDRSTEDVDETQMLSASVVGAIVLTQAASLSSVHIKTYTADGFAGREAAVLVSIPWRHPCCALPGTKSPPKRSCTSHTHVTHRGALGQRASARAAHAVSQIHGVGAPLAGSLHCSAAPSLRVLVGL